MKKTIFIFTLLLLPGVSSAADIRLAPPMGAGVGDTIEIAVLLSADAPVNAVSGVVRYSESLRFIRASDGNSIVSLWVSNPRSTDKGIEFAGLVPGGYAGRDGVVFKAYFSVATPGDASLNIDEPVVLSNDGTGRAERISSEPLRFVVSAIPQGAAVSSPDLLPPEVFAVERGRGNMLDGRAYAVFAAVDKGSGIDRYEAAERRFPFMPLVWRSTESPHVFADQYGTSDLYVKAFDHAGNERLSLSLRQHLLRPYEWVALALVILLAGTFYYWYAKQ